ncbi:p-hydroxycinnamoyl CoA hydratase/lyase [Actinosynnema pretiosum subsp. pretiosum]|uniref:Enoyl-CoA hydratase/isomerase n=2 Tax=Actinosynnema TaxID=40566 RepID=C6WH52_ACTMD|nr:p-hydroxycinnamoyl CoA hydratase/lyase [Actinosynnema mirum]ACU37971.1 Enoyl-CoA hydratase/isomerase [Actinosynnema mirum DSM 43827]AXX31465.1 Enoyl-CoA hydratase [Actinosynnema pretiosum subsp. pretiosum]QUF04494.1 p-hydroxycinnamoyl CoA hydratase/lyase [Actinosynnema pretiosum subsp. pretiosum]
MITLETVNVEIDGPRATIYLNRPDKKNAMNPQMHGDMNRALDAIEEAGTVKAVVVTGNGDSFSSGMDLEECFLRPFDDPQLFHRTNLVALTWFKRLKAFPAVTIAKVNGFAFGGGFLVTGLCDLAVASETALIGLSEINFGIFPAGGATWAATHNLARKQALYYILTGEAMTGKDAERHGLVNRAVPADQLDAATDELVGKIVKKNPITLQLAKQVYEGTTRLDLPAAIDYDQAKLWELSRLSGNEWINVALRQFEKRSYQPGLSTYERGEKDAVR